MTRIKMLLAFGLGMALVIAVGVIALPRGTLEAREADRVAASSALAQPPEAPEAQAAAPTPLILQYAAKFVCLEPLRPGTFHLGPTVPMVKESTGVVIHNPNGFPVRFYKKAVRAPVENPQTIAQGVAPGKWVTVTLAPDYAFHIDCDDIAKLLTGDPAATSIGTFGIGNEVEGYVVVAIGPQTAAGTNFPLRYASLDVTAEYVRGSEVLKKDIHYQPWWWWWWWQYPVLPWRLGYAYERVVPIPNLSPAVNVDCRSLLYDQLHQDVDRVLVVSPTLQLLTNQALDLGAQVDPTNIGQIPADTPPALVALIGRCNKIFASNAWVAEIDYVLVSNKGPTDPDPRGGPNQPAQALYPWWPGRWYDLPLVMPQNVSTNIDQYFRDWHSQWWISNGTPAATVNAAMVYWFPNWCGWGYWWWWWNGGDCIDIGVGEGESLDVEQIAPTRVFMNVWPPQ